jgi:predicted secreted protein
MRFSIASLVLSTVFATVACGGSNPTVDDETNDELRTQATAAVELGDADDGKTVTVEKGKEVHVSLSAIPSAGYRWTVVSTDRSFGYPDPKDGTYSETSPARGGGGGGKQLFVWKTASPFLEAGGAAHEVKLEYRRSWETDKPAAKTFSFKVKVKAAGAAPTPDPTPELSDVKVDKDDDGKKVSANEGQKVVLTLPSNTASSGYDWHVESVDRTLGQPTESHTSGPQVGGSGSSIFTWETKGGPTKVGSHDVKLKYSRGAAGAADETFSFTIEIKPAAE